MKSTVTKCDQCHDVIPEGARRISLKATLTLTNSHERVVEEDLPDICSAKCLHDVVIGMVEQAEKMAAVQPTTSGTVTADARRWQLQQHTLDAQGIPLGSQTGKATRPS